MILLLLGCKGVDSDTDAIDTDLPPSTICAEAEERLGYRPCVTEVPDEPTWQSITVPGGAEVVKITKYVAPARDDSRLPVVFDDAHT